MTRATATPRGVEDILRHADELAALFEGYEPELDGPEAARGRFVGGPAQGVAPSAFESFDEDDYVVCTYHKRFLPCRRCYEDPHEGDWSSHPVDVQDVADYQNGV